MRLKTNNGKWKMENALYNIKNISESEGEK